MKLLKLIFTIYISEGNKGSEINQGFNHQNNGVDPSGWERRY